VKASPAALLAAVNLLFFWPVLFHGRVFSSHDVVLSLPPWRAASGVLQPENRLLADAATALDPEWRSLARFPRGLLWNPSIAGGIPGAINVVQGNLSPFSWLPARLLPEAAVETGVLFLKLNLGFLFAYAFFRSREFSKLAAATGAAAWSWSSVQSVWWLWMQTSVTVAIPLLLWAVDRARAEGPVSSAVAPAGAAILLFLSGGYPYFLIYGFAAAGLYLAVAARTTRLRAGAARARLVAAAALAAGILLPFFLVSARFLRETGALEARQGLAASGAMPLRQLWLYLAPDRFGDPRRDDYRPVGLGPSETYMETAVAVGPLVLGLAALAIANRRRRRLLAYAALISAAVAIPLYGGGALLRWVGEVPLVSTGHFDRAKILIVFGLAIAAAIGAEAAEKALGDSPRLDPLLQAIPALVALPLLILAARFYPAVEPSRAVFTATPGIDALRRPQAGGPSRFLATGWTLLPDTAQAYGLEDVRGHLFHEARYRRLLAAADPRVYGRTGTLLTFDSATLDPGSPALDLLGVRAIAEPPGALSPTDLPVLYRGPDVQIFARPGALARFRFVRQAREGGVAESARADRATLASVAFVPARDLESLRGRLGPPGPESAGSLRIVRSEADRFELEAELREPAVLVSSQKLFAPYWQARLDGRRVRALLVDGLFLGVLVPAGRHRIVGSFRIPAAEWLVGAASAATLLALAAAAVLSRRKPARR
jgi:hypothetical protein